MALSAFHTMTLLTKNSFLTIRKQYVMTAPGAAASGRCSTIASATPC
jgi:ABC-type microcin C transport system permease subunit YejB